MYVLAFDTCFGACSAAVFQHTAQTGLADATGLMDQSACLAARDEPMAVGHAERLMPMIAEVMTESGLSFADLDAIAVTPGPGTFTGVRTGISAARGLALATKLPVLGLGSLELIARRARVEMGGRHAGDHVAVCMDAGKGQLYAQLFGLDTTPVSDPLLTTAADIQIVLMRGSWAVVGTAAAAVVECHARRAAPNPAAIGNDVRIVAHPSQPSARYLQGARLQPMNPPRPLYLRAPDAIPQANAGQHGDTATQANAALPRAHP